MKEKISTQPEFYLTKDRHVWDNRGDNYFLDLSFSKMKILQHKLELSVFEPVHHYFLKDWRYEGDVDAQLVLYNPSLDPGAWDIGHDRIADIYFSNGHLVCGKVSKSTTHDVCHDSTLVWFPSQFRRALNSHFQGYKHTILMGDMIGDCLRESNLPPEIKSRFRSIL